MPTLNHPPQQEVDPLRPDGPPDDEGLEQAPAPKATRSRKGAEEKAPTPAAVEAAMAILRQAGMDVKIAEPVLGDCPDDPITGRKGYFQQSRSTSGHRTVLRVYSGFEKDAKGVRKESPKTTGRVRRGAR